MKGQDWWLKTDDPDMQSHKEENIATFIPFKTRKSLNQQLFERLGN